MPDSSPNDFTEQGMAGRRYALGVTDRQPFLDRAIRCSSLTLTNLFRLQGSNSTTDTVDAWQSVGARLVNNLTSKLTVTIFPPGIPFIRLNPSKQVIADLLKVGDEKSRGALKQSISKGLSAAEKEFNDAVNEDGDSAHFTVTHKYLIVGGNHGHWHYQDGSMRTISFENWVVWRDQQGNPLEWVIKDCLSYATAPADIQAFLDSKGWDKETGEVVKQGTTASRKAEEASKETTKNIDLYTHGTLIRDDVTGNMVWDIYQEILGFVVPDTRWKWAKEFCPFQPIPLDLLPGENYGRSYVENYEADLQTLDGLTETLTEGSAAAALLIRLVKPGGVTSKDALAKARNGAVITGDETDVATLETNKNADFQTVQTLIQQIIERLAAAFLLNQTRNAERVTAEEIRFMAQELQDSLGGLYSGLIVTEQAPYARIKMAALMRTKRMTPLPPKQIKVMIVTGAAALGRNAELAALDGLLNVPATMAQVIVPVVNPVLYMQRRSTALGVDQEGLILTQEEVDANTQQQMQQQSMLAATPNLVNQGGALLKGAQDHAAKTAQIDQQATVDAAAQQPQGPSQ